MNNHPANFKRCFHESHSYIEICDPKQQYHYIHDPECRCDAAWIAYMLNETVYITRVPTRADD